MSWKDMSASGRTIELPDIGMTNFFETDSETETIYGQNSRPRLRLRPEIAKIRDRD